MQETRNVGLIPWSGRSWSMKWQPTPVFFPVKSHGQRSLAGCSPWGRKESDMIELLSAHTHTPHTLKDIYSNQNQNHPCYILFTRFVYNI